MANAQSSQVASTSFKTERPKALWAVTLYYAQGLPFSLVRQMSVVFFKDQGVSLKSLGMVALYGIPWTFKFLWSPFVDQFSDKKKWVVAMECLLACALGLVSFLVFQGSVPATIATVFFAVAVIAATHDIAVDGFYLEALAKDEQALYSGWIVAAYRIAMLTGGGLLVSLSARVSWGTIFALAGGLLLSLALWHHFMLPAPKEKKPLTDVAPLPLLEGFRTFFTRKNVVLAIAFIVFFKLGDALLFGMSTPFLLDAGLPKEKLGLISGVFGTISAITASIGGGLFIAKYSLKRGLYIFGVIQNLAIPVYAFVAWRHAGTWGLGGAVIVEQISAGLGTAAYSNFVMRQTDPQYRATHYAIATGMMSLTTMLGGVMSGFGAQHFGYPIFFTLAFGASIPGLLLIPWVARRPECQ